MELNEEERGTAGIFLSRAMNYGPLLQMALQRQGFETILISSLQDPALREKEITLVIGDLSSVENSEEEIRLHEAISSLPQKNIILPGTDERNRPFQLDFFWLESQVKKAIEKAG